jgi:hypothetical protein
LPSPLRRLALVATALAFFLWIGYLAFLAYTASHPIVLSRPQILVSNLIIIAQLQGGAEHPDKTATVVQSVWTADPASQPAAKTTITVGNLEQISAADAHHPRGGWRGPGEYILPLVTAGKDTYRVTPIPPSPGYSGTDADRLRIYPVTPMTREELERIVRQYHSL